jgi:hypothetical protein
MPTAKECRLHAETCLSLARESWEICVKMALIELAKEFRAMANTWKREEAKSSSVRGTTPHAAH